MKKTNKNKEIVEKYDIKNNKGLTISYDRDELNKKFPHLLTEITGKKKTAKFDLRGSDSDPIPLNQNSSNPEELINPNVGDFIRRCSNEDEALDILDYLLRRKEISKSDYKSIKIQILKQEGLQEFIDKHGGFKSPGYYERKYRDPTRETLEQEDK
ncbi:MAG: DUF2095 family protein [Promethearchaeota archaeon]|jgi:hypothetical protein